MENQEEAFVENNTLNDDKNVSKSDMSTTDSDVEKLKEDEISNENNSVNNDKSNSKNDMDNSDLSEKMLYEDNISRSNVELLKFFDEVLNIFRNIPLGTTINNFGDIYNDNATNNGGGHGNLYNDQVTIGNNLSEDKNKVTEKNKKRAQVNLDDYNSVYMFLKEHQQSPYCSLLIVLSIFDKSQYNLVVDETKIFYEMLVEESRASTDNDGKTIVLKREPFEISRHDASVYFSVKFYQDIIITRGSKFLTDFIGFSSDEHSINVLKCVFSEFITLKDKVTAFLTKLICSEKIVLYVTAINTLKKICNINPEYFISKIVIRLTQNKSIPSDIAIAQILCSIAEHSKNQNRADKYLSLVPNIDKDIHYYVITLMMCKPLLYKREKIGDLIRPVLWELINQPRLQLYLKQFDIDLPKEENFINNIDLFFNIGDRYVEFYSSLISELCKIFRQLKKDDTRRDFVCLVALLFVHEDYNESVLNTKDPSKFKDMIFVRMVLRDKETSENLIFLWGELLRNRRFKIFAEKILENYLSQRNDFVKNEIEYLKIEFFFSKLASVEKICKNILFFLMNISTRPQNPIPLAGKIYKKIGG